MRKPGGVAAKWSKATDVRLFHGKSTGDREGLSPQDRGVREQPSTARPVARGKAPIQSRSEARLLPSCCSIPATRSSHRASKDGVHEGR